MSSIFEPSLWLGAPASFVHFDAMTDSSYASSAGAASGAASPTSTSAPASSPGGVVTGASFTVLLQATKRTIEDARGSAVKNFMAATLVRRRTMRTLNEH